jgi:hypothetical protein
MTTDKIIANIPAAGLNEKQIIAIAKPPAKTSKRRRDRVKRIFLCFKESILYFSESRRYFFFRSLISIS